MEQKANTNENVLEVEGLSKHFRLRGGFFARKERIVRAVDGISFSVRRGETLGLVGESGCGKSTAARTIVRLYEPTAGKITIAGADITRMSQAELTAHRRHFQMIFQDPYASLNPRMTVREILGEPLEVHLPGLSPAEREERVMSLLSRVGLGAEQAGRYPHEFSGGQRQRIGIARALAVNPDFIVCDEAISALDVSIQAQVVNMLADLRDELGLSYLFIAHDLSMVRYLSDRVGVMYLGKLVELGPSEELYAEPLHPYTKALLAAIPVADPRAADAREGPSLEGEVPSPVDPPSGCRFRTRCPFAMKLCAEAEPPFAEAAPGRFVACHLCGGAS
jgi:oligopeptide transport system ATP-binding protein